MGSSNSINIEKRDNGIFEINVENYPNYPIAYLRLCLNLETNDYCIAEDCDIDKTFTGHRKIIVVGMRLSEVEADKKKLIGKRDAGIYEQAFYQSSGLNSVKTLENFLNKKFIVDENNADIWLPFSGFGYPSNIKSDEYYTNFKLLKNNFGCDIKSDSCLYGRFGQYEPNLMQISYCLGGQLWTDNFDNFLKYGIEKLPMLDNTLKELPCYYIPSKTTFKNNIECYTYLNNYIGPAMVFNYSESLLYYRNNILKYYNEDFLKILKLDFRIINILREKEIFEYRYSNKTTEFPTGSLFPDEKFFNYMLWSEYIKNVLTLYKKDKKYFNEYVLPIIQNEEIIVYSPKKEIKKTKIGTKENPFEKIKDASVGEYYTRGKTVCQRKK